MVTGASPDTPLAALTLAVVDVETTGLDAERGDRVCELALLRVAPGEAPLLLNGLVNPGRRIGAGASAVNGITDADVAGAPPFHELIPAIDGLVAGTALVAHNAPFDLSFLTMEYGRVGAPTPDLPVICTLALARRHCRFPSNSLGNLARELGLPAGRRAHRAASDVETTLAILRALLRHLAPLGLQTLADLLAAQGPPIRFGGGRGQELPPPLARALASGGLVGIRYVDGGMRSTDRLVRPIALRHNRLVAFCQLRQAEREFVLERIEAVWEATEG